MLSWAHGYPGICHICLPNYCNKHMEHILMSFFLKKNQFSSSASRCCWSRFNSRWKEGSRWVGRIPGLTNLKIPAPPQPCQHAPWMSLPSNMCLPWNFLCFILCTHVLQYNLSLEKEEVEDVFNTCASLQLLITLVLRNQKESHWKVIHNDCSPQERVEDRQTAF